MRKYFESPQDLNPGFESEFIEYFEVYKKYINAYDNLSEFTVEKKPHDSETVPGFIYELPEGGKLLKLGDLNYSKYMCRGNAINDLTFRLYPFTGEEDSPLSFEAKEFVNQELGKLRAMYLQRDESGTRKLMRTTVDMEFVRKIVRDIVDRVYYNVYPEKKSNSITT